MIKNNNATLEQLNIDGVTYQYINYNDNKKHNSVAGLFIPITPDVRKTMLNMGGFYEGLLKPLQNDESIHTLTILSITERGMRQLIVLFFDNGKTIETLWTYEPNVVRYFERRLKGNSIPYENINTLEFLQENKDDVYHQILNNYYNPQVVNDTGIYVDGTMIEYGDTVYIHNIPKLIEKHDNLKNSLYDKLKINGIQVGIHGNVPGFTGSIGDGLIYRDYGEFIPNLEVSYHNFFEEEGKYESYQDFKTQYEINMIHRHALRANQAIDIGHRDKNDLIRACIKNIEHDLKNFYEPAKEVIGISFLVAAIEMNLVSIERPIA